MSDYLEPNIDKYDAINIIKNSIEDDKSFLFTRFGDGEFWIIKEELNDIRLNRIKNEWLVNDNNYKKILKKVRSDLIECFNNSDLIGIMGRNHNEYGVSINYDPNTWSIKSDLAKKIGIHNSKITDHMLSRSNEIGNVNNFKKILNGRPIHVISPNTDFFIKNNLSKILDCKITYTKITRKPNSVIYNRENLLKNLDKINENIVIFGCGAGGKFIGSYLNKNHNKICLDFGATLDAWANKNTRSWFKSTQKYLKII